MRINIFSDLQLEHHLNISEARFCYSEGLSFPEVSDEIVIFIFCSTYRFYTRDYQNNIIRLIREYEEKNHVLSINDFDNNVVGLLSDMNSLDFDLGVYAQMPFKKSTLQRLEVKIKGFIRSVIGSGVKCVFVDLDNTLIPGVWEEDKDFVRANLFRPEYRSFVLLHSFLKRWQSWGVQIIVVSKNDRESIVEALDFCDPAWNRWVTGINHGWSSKGKRILDIVKRLNIGQDSCIFIDDNPVEIKSVRDHLPLISVFKFTGSFEALYAELESNGYIQLMRSSSIQERFIQYKRILSHDNNIDDDSDDLKFSFTTYFNEQTHYARILELSGKTNQFNFAKKILKENELLDSEIISWDCRTEFGYLGVVGYSIIRSGVMENFVMSCRALGFNLEAEIFKEIYDKYNPRAIKFIESDRNSVARKFFDLTKEKYGIEEIS